MVSDNIYTGVMGGSKVIGATRLMWCVMVDADVHRISLQSEQF
jgi:hypothetical protein